MALSDVISGVVKAIITTTPTPFVEEPTILRPALGAAFGAGYGDAQGEGTAQDYARIRVWDTVTESFLVLGSVDGEPSTTIEDLLLQNSAEMYTERMSPMYTFGQSIMFTAGPAAKQFSYSAIILVNKKEGDSKARFRALYESTLRVSKLVAQNPRVVEFRYRDQLRVGYITSLQMQLDSRVPNQINLAFSLFVVNTVSLTQ